VWCLLQVMSLCCQMWTSEMLLPMLLRVFLIMKQPSYRHRYIWLWVLARKTRPKVLRDAGTGGWQMIHTCKPIAIFSGCASTVFRWWNEKSGIGVPQRWLNFEFPLHVAIYLHDLFASYSYPTTCTTMMDGWASENHIHILSHCILLLNRRRNFINYLSPE
jgi:hypothetical protein